MGHHAVTERRKTGSASDLVEVESHDFNRGSVSTDPHHLSRYALRIFGCFGNARVGLFNEIDAGYFWKGAKDVWVKT